MSVARWAFYTVWSIVGQVFLLHYYGSYSHGGPFLTWTYDGRKHSLYITGEFVK